MKYDVTEMVHRFGPVQLAIARAFARRVRDDPDLPKIISRNRREPNPGVCHTHDFYDANMTMLAAFEEVTGREGSPSSQRDTDIWNVAWSLAKWAEFDPRKVGKVKQIPADWASAPKEDK